jgi:site-specific recombinase XerD
VTKPRILKSRQKNNKDSLEKGVLKLIDEFIQELKWKKRAFGTITAYRSYLYSFFLYAGKDVTDISYLDITKWLEEMDKKGKSKATRELGTTSLSSFFRFCKSKEYLSISPLDHKVDILQ